MITWCPTCGGPIGPRAKRPEGCRLCWLESPASRWSWLTAAGLPRHTPHDIFGPASLKRWTVDYERCLAMWRPHRELANGRTPVGSVNHYRMVAGLEPIPPGEADHPMFAVARHPEMPPGSDWVPPNARREAWPPWDVNMHGWLISPDDEDNPWR